jgi:hypothetical protein
MTLAQRRVDAFNRLAPGWPMPEFGNRGDSGGLSKPGTAIDAALARAPGSQRPGFKCGEYRGQQWGGMAEALHAEFVGPRKLG